MTNSQKSLIEKSHDTLNKLLNEKNKTEAENSNTSWSFSVQHTPILFPAFKRALDTIALTHKRSLLAGTARGVLVTGQAGSGKTTLLRQYCAKFPSIETTERRLIPALYVPAPSRPSVKYLAQSVLIAMEAPFVEQTGEGSTDRIVDLLQKCQTQILCFDEIHHIVTALDKREFARATEWLKTITNRLEIPVVLAGLPKSVLMMQSNGQLRRRFSTQIYLKPFSMVDKANALEFCGVLKSLRKSLPIPSPDFSSDELSTRFFYATNGIIDYVAQILDGAMVCCLTRAKLDINVADFAEAFVNNVWSDCPADLNPFLAPIESLRHLNEWGEPFGEWDDPAVYQQKSKAAKSKSGAKK